MAFTIELAKPATVTGFAIPALTGGLAGDDIIGVEQGAFRMKVQRYRIATTTTIANVTGDGDEVSAFESNLQPVTVINLTGFMLAEQAIGLDNLASVDNDGTWAFKLLLSSDRTFSGFAVMRGFEIVGEIQYSEANAVACTLFVTNTATDELEGTLAAQV